MDPAPDPVPDPDIFRTATKTFFSNFSVHLVEGTFTSFIFSKIKSHTDVTKQLESRFTIYA
jgi:hypothetical protein